jgi:hypothetical protein
LIFSFAVCTSLSNSSSCCKSNLITDLLPLTIKHNVEIFLQYFNISQNSGVKQQILTSPLLSNLPAFAEATKILAQDPPQGALWEII